MINPIKIIQDNPRLSIGLTALAIIFLAIFLITSSRSGSDIQVNNIDNNQRVFLEENIFIMGWSSIDRDSAHIGEVVNYQINILYNPSEVSPDLNAFERSVDVTPLEKIGLSEVESYLDNGLEKYVLDYRLQAVNVELDTDYKLDPSVIYYTSQGESELKSLPIASPSIRVSSYYPYDVSDIELKGIKGQVQAYSSLTRGLLGLSGLLLLALWVFSLWRYCIKKPDSDLSRAEILWLEFKNLDKSIDYRLRAAEHERIITRLIEAKTATKPEVFWSGKGPVDNYWKNVAGEARNLLRNNYRPEGPNETDAGEVADLLQQTFTNILNEEKRMVLAEPSFLRRLIGQKNILVISSACLISGVLMLIFFIWPGTWVPQNLQRYNELVDVVSTEDYIDEFAIHFSDLAKEATDNRIKAAAFFNAGTLIADNVQDIDEDQMFSEGGAFSDVAADERVIQDAEDLLEILALNVEKYRQAELLLRESVRTATDDENIRRNLEIIIKRRKAVLHIINTLIETGHLQQVEIDEMLDLMDSQMALEFKIEEGQEAPGYYIGEDF